MHIACLLTFEWSSHFDHQFTDDKMYSYLVEYLERSKETSKMRCESTITIRDDRDWYPMSRDYFLQ
ncbi:hypothetical protein Tco_0330275, partial [Tanacetum coccineum]